MTIEISALQFIAIIGALGGALVASQWFWLKRIFAKFESMAESVSILASDMTHVKSEQSRQREDTIREQLRLQSELISLRDRFEQKYDDIVGFLQSEGFQKRDDRRPKIKSPEKE